MKRLAFAAHVRNGLLERPLPDSARRVLRKDGPRRTRPAPPGRVVIRPDPRVGHLRIAIAWFHDVDVGNVPISDAGQRALRFMASTALLALSFPVT